MPSTLKSLTKQSFFVCGLITHPSSPTIRFARDLSYYWEIGHTGSDFQFTSQTPGVVMHMNHDGNVGIATINPQTKLHVDEGIILADGSSTNHGFELRRDNFDTFQMRHLGGNFTIRNFTDNRTDLSIDGAGKVGIGSSVPNEKLTVVGNISATGQLISSTIDNLDADVTFLSGAIDLKANILTNQN